MIAAWMAYAIVIATLVSTAALTAERIAVLRKLQRRWIWASALLLSLVLPGLFAWQGASSSERRTAALVALAARETPVYAQSPIAWVGGSAHVAASRASIDAWLVAGWSAMSVLVLATLSIGWLQLRRRLRGCSLGEVNGVSVTIADDLGPAVVGIIRPRIVISALACGAGCRYPDFSARS